MTDPTPTPRTPADSDTDLAETQMQQPESTIFGGYEILSEVSRGGMGVVYKARQLSLGRVVALKLVLSGSDASDGELLRFQEEAKAAAQLDHPHIVPVYEIGEHNGQHFFSMGFVDGPSLSVRLAQSGPLPPREAAELLSKMAEAVDYAHRQGVIHRDLKPGNVLLTSSGEPKVTDFGLAKRLESDQSLTATGQVFGTPAYMSPEQAQGDHELIGPASDVYSLGATLFAALTGRPPFTSTVIHELLIQVTEEPPPSLRALNASVPLALEAICLKCLAKSPADRYPTAGALAEDLGRFLGSERVVAARQSLTSRFGRWIATAAVVGIAMIAGIRFGRNKTVVLPPAASSRSEVGSTTSSATASAIAPRPAPADENLLQALSAAQDAMLPTPTGNVWLYRYADGATACENAFHEYGFLVDKGDPSQVTESLARRSDDFRESVICGLELWELCAIAAKQTAVIEPLRQAQDALDTLAWRRSLRLARADADEKIFLLAIREGISQSPTPEQFAILAMQIACRPPNLSTEALATLRILRQQAPDEYRVNLTLAISLQIYGRTNPDKKSSCASESVIPLRAAAKALPTSALPYMQLAAVYKDLDNVEAAAIESDRGYLVLFPEAWPLIDAARKAREKGDFSEAVKLVREALVKQPDVSFGDVELAANLILNGQDSEAEPWLQKVANGSPDPTVSFEALEEVFRIVESSSPDGHKMRNAAVTGNGARELAWNCYCNFRSKLGKTFPPLALAPFDAEQAKAHQVTCATSLGLPVEYTNSLGMKFRLIPPGEYLRGSTEEEMALVRHDHPRNPHWASAVDSEGPRHRVVLTKPFYLSIYETRQSDYETLVGVNPAQFSALGKEKSKVVGIDTSKYPVENVSWNDVAEFCAKLSRREQLAPFYSRSGEVVTVLYGDGYRLPTEAEWEYACRAGTTTIYWTGESESSLQGCEWYVNNSGGVPHPVGELAASPFGLFDMAGNIYEFCQDAFAKDSYSRYAHQTAMDPLVKPEEQIGKPVRKCRGGGFSVFGVAGCRSAFRNHLGVTDAGRTAGFRVALSIEAVRQLLKQPTSSVPHGRQSDAPKTAIAPFDAEQAKQHQEAWAKHRSVPVDYTNSIGMKFSLIPPGEFTMGSTPEEIEEALKATTGPDKQWRDAVKSQPLIHKVFLTQPYYLGIHEVTQAQYERVMGTNPSLYAPTGARKEVVAGIDTSTHPVEMVGWYDAAQFCAKLSQQDQLKPFYLRAGESVTMLDGNGYRLPTEAEWEFACRAGTTTSFWFGDNDEDLTQAGWIFANSQSRMHAVGELKANPFGLFDMYGNVWEWVQDAWDPSDSGLFPKKFTVDPMGPSTAGSQRLIRGGAFNNRPPICRGALSRLVRDAAMRRGFNLGFRVVLTVEAVKAAMTELMTEPANASDPRS